MIKYRFWNGEQMIYNVGIHPFIMQLHEKDEDAETFEERYYSKSEEGCMTVLSDSEGLMLFTGLKDKHGKDVYAGDFVKFTRIFGFHSELLEEHKLMHNLPTINGIGGLFEGIIVADINRGLMIKSFNSEYAEPLFTRLQRITPYHDWKTAEITGNIYEQFKLPL